MLFQILVLIVVDAQFLSIWSYTIILLSFIILFINYYLLNTSKRTKRDFFTFLLVKKVSPKLFDVSISISTNKYLNNLLYIICFIFVCTILKWLKRIVFITYNLNIRDFWSLRLWCNYHFSGNEVKDVKRLNKQF